MNLFRQGPGPKSPLVRVMRKARPMKVLQEDGTFYNLVHEADKIRRNDPTMRTRRQIVEVVIKFAGARAHREVTLFGRTFRFPRLSRNWEQEMIWDRGPLSDIRIPRPEDVEHEKQKAGAMHAGVFIQTFVQLS